MVNKLEVKNLVLSKIIPNTQENIIILKGINTFFESGKINAILAPNGSGKTTLLNIVFGNCDTSTNTSGEILLNDELRKIQSWFDDVSFVEQDSYKIIDQTVESLIEFAIKIKQKERKLKISKENIDEIYEALNLRPILHKNVNSISGGERKRAMIAIELVMMKKILILDEPTSDLDSYLALKLITFLQKIAKQNDIMVILTIHQPSDQIFKRFDNILFLLEGKVVYSGESSQLINFFQLKGINKPQDWTISDFLFEAFYNKSEFEEFTNIENLYVYNFVLENYDDFIITEDDIVLESLKPYVDDHNVKHIP